MEETRPERNSQGRESGDQTDRIKLSVMTLAVIPVLQMFQMTGTHKMFLSDDTLEYLHVFPAALLKNRGFPNWIKNSVNSAK